MSRKKIASIFALLVASQLVLASTAEAGPLLDWLRNRWRCCRPAQPVQTLSPACGTCTTTCQQTCQRVVVNYVPCTAYRATWERVPVTTYRTTTSTDPCTGCTVTCNRPCTTYTWRMKQVPYTTYRPVYRTETYQVPVTYTTPAPATTVSPGCNSCGVPSTSSVVQAPTGTISPGTTTQPYYQSTPSNGSTTLEPADRVPTLEQNSQRPVIIEGEGSVEGEINSSSSTAWPNQIQTQRTNGQQYTPIRDPNPDSRWNGNSSPQLLSPFNKTTQAPSVEQWDYSPVRLASYEEPARSSAVKPSRHEYVGTWQTASPRKTTRVNEGWRRD